MSAIPQPTSSRFVSERILEPLRQVARRQWTVLATRGVIQTLLFSLGLILAAVLILGRFNNIPVWVRIPVAAIVWGLVIGSAIRFLRPALRRRSLVRTALDVEAKLLPTRDTHERISSSVELSAEKDSRFAGSPALVAYLVKQAEADAAAVDPRAVVPTDKVKRLGMLLVPLLLLWVAMVWFMPREKMLLPMYHLLMPWKTAPAVLSHVEVDPGDKTLAQGDNLEVRVHVNADSVADRDRKIEHAALTMTEAKGHPVVQEMTRTGPRDFYLAMENLQKGFQYHVGTDEGDSPDFTIVVNPRPAVEQLDLRYDYPAYTGLEAKLDTNSETGNIDAIQNTKVTIVVHCSNTLTPESRIVVTDRVTSVKPEPRDYPLTRAADGTYQAQIVVTNSAQYVIKLTNNYGLTNKDDQPHLITVRFDEKPTIAITSPQSGMTVRPDDIVPVEFLATDDFGVAKVDAYIQVDGAPEGRPLAVKLGTGDRHSISSTYKLDVAAALSDAKLPDAQGLTYWLTATDNRDPDPQSTESAHQTLRLDRNAKGIAEQLDEKRAHDLMEAIRKAINEIEQEKWPAESFKGIDHNRELTNDEKQNVETLKDKVEKTSNDLVAVADEHKEDKFADVAAKAKAISEKYILGAADDVSKVELHADSADARSADAQQAVVSLTEARKLLEELLKQAEKQEKNVETADKLKDLAKDQQKLAEKAAQAQPNQPQDQSQQQQVAQKTQQAVGNDQPLNNEKAQHEAQKLAELENKVAQIEKAQEQQEQQVQKQAAAAEVQQQANAVAQKQEALNQKIEDLKKNDKSALEKAGAQPPQAQQQENIVKELNKNQLQQATNDQKNAAQQLENAANQLQQKANDNNLQPNADQQAALNKEQQDAQQAQQQAQQAQQQAQQAQQTQQATNQAAQQAQQQAQKADASADQKKNAAQQAAQAAQQAAQVARQVEQQAKATEKQAEAAAADTHPDVQDAAKQAEQNAQAAEKAADAAEKAADQAQVAAQQGDAQQAAQDAQQAGQDAAQAAQQEQAAAQALAQADNKEGEHTKGEILAQQKEQAAEAAAQAHELAKEQAALAEATQPDAQALQQAQQGAEPTQQAAEEQKHLAKEAKQAQAAAQQLQNQAAAQGDQELAKRAEAAEQDLKHAEAAADQAAQAEAAGQPDQAAGQQEKAENALAQAEQALRGEAPQADAGKPDAAQPDAGKPDAGKPDAAQADAGKPDGGQGQAQAGEPHPGEPGQAQAAAQQAATPEQAQAQAAEHAQEAIQAQQQAQQGNAAASQEAAQALAQAAQELAQANNPSGQPGSEPGQEPGQDPGQGDMQNQPSPVAGQAADPKMGLQAKDNAAGDGRPDSVQQLGISASDWARLGPLQQKELMNAAQQSGPPTYQAMIKNYYVRLAHMQAQGSALR
jgi:hypothetical protein